VWHAIKIDAGLDIVLKFVLQVAASIPLKEGETIMCRTGSVCFLNDESSAVIETLQRSGNRECQQQSQ